MNLHFNRRISIKKSHLKLLMKFNNPSNN